MTLPLVIETIQGRAVSIETGLVALLMRLGVTTLRGSNPRSSAPDLRVYFVYLSVTSLAAVSALASPHKARTLVTREGIIMTGEVVSRPITGHVCAPGWREAVSTGPPFGEGHRYSVPPSASDFPKGTVWRCECGRTWVSTGRGAGGSPNFRREGRWARKRRERHGNGAS